MVCPALQRGLEFRLAGLAPGIAQGHGHIAQPARMTYAPDRAAFGHAQERGLVPGEEMHQLRTRQSGTGIEVRQLAGLGKLVQGQAS